MVDMEGIFVHIQTASSEIDCHKLVASSLLHVTEVNTPIKVVEVEAKNAFLQTTNGDIKVGTFQTNNHLDIYNDNGNIEAPVCRFLYNKNGETKLNIIDDFTGRFVARTHEGKATVSEGLEEGFRDGIHFNIEEDSYKCGFVDFDLPVTHSLIVNSEKGDIEMFLRSMITVRLVLVNLKYLENV